MPSPIYSKTLLDFHREMLCSHIGLIIEYKNNGSELYSSTMLCYEKRGVLRAPAGENGRHPTAAPLVTDKYGNPECTLFRMLSDSTRAKCRRAWGHPVPVGQSGVERNKRQFQHL